MLDLKGRVALVTGVSRRIGIGFGIAKALAEIGSDLFLQSWTNYDAAMPWGADKEGMDSLINDLRNMGVRVEHQSVDFMQVDSAQTLMDAAVAAYGHLDIVIANHTYSVDVGLADLNAEILDKHLGINVRATMLLAKAFAAQHDGRAGGRFIMMTSGQGISPMPDNLAYAISKAALEGITLSLSSALIGRGITVNTIDPGATDTGWADAELYEIVKQAHPLKRWGTPEDAARLIRWLVSEEGQWVTGQVIHSRGGL